MKAHELAGDDWVLVDPNTQACILDPSGKGLITFVSKEQALLFKAQQGPRLASFEATQVKDMIRH